MAGRLEGRRVLVTGAGGGIGRATVDQCRRAGARVAGLDLPDVPLPEVELELRADLTRPEEVRSAVAVLESAWGGLDGLVNVAGGSGRAQGDGPVHECTDEGWRWTLALNLDTTFHCCREALPLLVRSGGGSVVNVSSVLALGGHEHFDTHAYAAAKGAVIALSRAMAIRYAAERVRVNVLAPSLIRTPMSRRAQTNPEIMELLRTLQPLTGTFGEPDDVAAAALFLLSDEARFITGAVLPVDGGWSAR